MQKWQPENLAQIIKEHGGGRHSGERFGSLVVLHVHNKIAKQRRKVDCMCRCGRIVTKYWDDVLNYRDKACGYEECKWTKKALEKLDENHLAAVVDKIKPKWICRRTDEDCAISAICGICCAECDRKSRCEMACRNNPAACGGSERRERTF